MKFSKSISSAARWITLVAICIIIFSRPYIEAYRSNQLGQRLLQEGHTAEGIQQLRVAVSWRAPFDTSSAAASFALTTIAESTTPSEHARLASEELWRGIFSSRSIWWDLPGAWRGVRSERAQELLRQQLQVSIPSVTTPVTSSPNFYWQFVACIAFIVWVISVLKCIFTFFTPQGGFILESSRHGISYVAISTISFAVWLCALSFA